MDKKNPYEDIMHLPHPVSKSRRHMTMLERAAQFSPFAALTGYDDTILETARLTEERMELDEESIAILNTKLQVIAEHINKQPQITVTYFEKDERKSGGCYITVTGHAKKIDLYDRVLVLTDQTAISLDMIHGIDGDLF